MDFSRTKYLHFVVITILSVGLFEGCSNEENQNLKRVVPAAFDSLPPWPEYNPMNKSKVELGRLLFNDKRLSADGKISCASCHIKNAAYSDTIPVSPGVHGRMDRRNAYSLVNVGYQKDLFMDGGVPNLELQAIAPFLNENEMAFDLKSIEAEIGKDKTYLELVQKAFAQDSIDPKVVAYSLAAFERTLLSTGSPYDAFIQGDSTVLSDSQLAGMNLFFSDRTQCSSCHTGFLFTDQNYYNLGMDSLVSDEGRARISQSPDDLGKFKTPSLRNVGITAPYMHDGGYKNLDEVLDFYNSGGLNVKNKDQRIRELNLTRQERNQIIEFLQALTDL